MARGRELAAALFFVKIIEYLLNEWSVHQGGFVMASDITLLLILAATAATGILAGASLDQSIKQLPARHRIGMAAFSAYSRAADLGNGIVWYAVIGIGAAALTIAAAVAAHLQGQTSGQAPLDAAAALAVLHSLVTTQAAPTNFSQRGAMGDEAVLARIFNRFERWQTLRAVLQVLNFGAMLWALVGYASAR
jgi:hypothetical protein